MVRQYPIPGALAAMAAIGAEADIVVLTNVGPEHQQGRIEQLARHDFHAPVIGRRGGKGEPVRRLIEQYRPSVDRQSVVEGKSGDVRVDLGGRRLLKKKN